MPGLGGRDFKSSINASSPPAEAPTPTTGKVLSAELCGSGSLRDLTGPLAGLLVRTRLALDLAIISKTREARVRPEEKCHGWIPYNGIISLAIRINVSFARNHWMSHEARMALLDPEISTPPPSLPKHAQISYGSFPPSNSSSAFAGHRTPT